MQVCVFMARPRSGSTVLRMALGAHKQICDMGEIFNEGNGRSYFHFSAARITSDKSWAMPSRNRQMFLDYVDNCKLQAVKWKPTADIIILDVKYEHLHFVYEAWQDFVATPLLFNLVESQKWSLIHLIRNDVLASVLSNFLAQQSNIYHRKAGEDTDTPRNQISVDIEAAYSQCEGAVRRSNEITKRFAAYVGYLTLHYESLFTADGTRFAEAPLKVLQKFFNLSVPIDLVPKLSKVVQGDPLDLIVNRDEVAAKLAPRVARLIAPGKGPLKAEDDTPTLPPLPKA